MFYEIYALGPYIYGITAQTTDVIGLQTTESKGGQHQMDNQTERNMPVSATDEQFTIDGIIVRVHYSNEQPPDVMEKIETLLYENLCAR